MAEAKKYKVAIYGEHYTLVSDEAEQHVMDAAMAVDNLMATLSRQSHITDAKKLAVMVALQFSSELKHLKESAEVYELEQNHIHQLIDKGLASIQEEI